MALSPRADELLRTAALDRDVVHACTADMPGISRAVAGLYEGLALREGGPEAVVVGVDLSGGSAQSLVSAMRAAGVQAELLLLCFGSGSPGEVADAACVAALACRQWGARVVQMAEEMAPLGAPIRLHRGPQRLPGSVIGLRVRIRPMLVRRVDPPEIRCRQRRGEPRQVRVLVQSAAEVEVRGALLVAQHAVQPAGTHVEWRTETMRPGTLPGMQGSEVFAITIHALLVHGPAAEQAARAILRQVRTHEGADGPGSLVSAWMLDDLRDAVMVVVPRGAVPTAVEGLRGVMRRYGVRPVIAGGVLAFSGAPPAVVDGILDEAGLRRWMATLTPAVRLGIGPPGASPAGTYTPCRLGHAAAGHDLQWLVRVDGVDCDEVGRAVGRLVGHPVFAAPVEAFVEEEQRYRPMVLIRAGPAAAPALHSLVAGGGRPVSRRLVLD